MGNCCSEKQEKQSAEYKRMEVPGEEKEKKNVAHLPGGRSISYRSCESHRLLFKVYSDVNFTHELHVDCAGSIKTDITFPYLIENRYTDAFLILDSSFEPLFHRRRANGKGYLAYKKEISSSLLEGFSEVIEDMKKRVEVSKVL